MRVPFLIFTINLAIGLSVSAQLSFIKYQYAEQEQTDDKLTSNLIQLPNGRFVWGTGYNDTRPFAEEPIFGSLSLCDPNGNNLVCTGVGGMQIDHLVYNPVQERIISLNSKTIRGISSNGQVIEWNKSISTSENIYVTGLGVDIDGNILIGMSGDLMLNEGTLGYTKISPDLSIQENIFYRIENENVNFIQANSEWLNGSFFHYGNVSLLNQEDPYILLSKNSPSAENSWCTLVNGSTLTSQMGTISFLSFQNHFYLIEQQNILDFNDAGEILSRKFIHLTINGQPVELINKAYLIPQEDNLFLVGRGYYPDMIDNPVGNTGIIVVKMNDELELVSGYFHNYYVSDWFNSAALIANDGIYTAIARGSSTLFSRIDMTDLSLSGCPVYELEMSMEVMETPEVINAELSSQDFNIVIGDTTITYYSRDYAMYSACEALNSDNILHEGQIEIYPNPNNTGNLSFQLDKHLEPCQAFISSLSGNRIHSFEVPGSQANFSVKLPGSLAAGLYMIEIPDYGVRKKLIIQ